MASTRTTFTLDEEMAERAHQLGVIFQRSASGVADAVRVALQNPTEKPTEDVPNVRIRSGAKLKRGASRESGRIVFGHVASKESTCPRAHAIGGARRPRTRHSRRSNHFGPWTCRRGRYRSRQSRPDRPSVINCDGLHTLTQASLTGPVGRVGDDVMRKVCSAISYALGC